MRLAALRSAEHYGWVEVVKDQREFVQTMKRVAAEADPELRRAALGTLSHIPAGE